MFKGKRFVTRGIAEKVPLLLQAIMWNMIDTDSYIAVQLIESQKKLNFKSLKYMAEKVDGSFSFSVIDSKDNLYIVNGDSPISIVHFKKKQVYVYASTTSILWKALVDTELFCDLKRGEYDDVEIQDGEILKISSKGKIKRGKFEFDEYGSYGYDWRKRFEYSNANEYVDDIKSVAQYYGYNSDEIYCLLNNGFTPEEMLYADNFLEV